MKQDIDSNLHNLIEWLQKNELAVSGFVPEKPVKHPILDRTIIIDNIIAAIKVGNLNAIELGCDLVLQNKHIPFGKLLKCGIFCALKPAKIDLDFLHGLDPKRTLKCKEELP